MRARGSRGLILGSLALLALGVLLLLNNFYLLSGINTGVVWPLIMVLVGAVILLRGDLLGGSGGRAFGITRGSVEAATVEINAAEIDVLGRSLTREGRLIAGHFAADSRPSLDVAEGHAYLRMDRAVTPWLAFNNWDINLARDLPWNLYISTSLGSVKLDLSDLLIQSAVVGTGFGDIHVTCPMESFEGLSLRSALGNVHLIAPTGCNARIFVHGPRMFRVRVDEARYEKLDERTYLTRDPAPDAPEYSIFIRGTFGDVYLA